MGMEETWKSLGFALHITNTEVDTISRKFYYRPSNYIRDILHAWLQQHYNTSRCGPPSWRLPCQAIHEEKGGNNPFLARKIAKKHRGKSEGLGT